MNYYKFDKKSDAVKFCSDINIGEGYIVSDQNVTTGYCQPVEFYGMFYVIADTVTGKYTTDTPISLDMDAPDNTPPTLSPYAVEIPALYQWAFPNDEFILNGFLIPLDTYNGAKVVNLAYFQWQEFRDELDRKDGNGNFVFAALKRSLMPLWDYVLEQVNNNNLIQL